MHLLLEAASCDIDPIITIKFFHLITVTRWNNYRLASSSSMLMSESVNGISGIV